MRERGRDQGSKASLGDPGSVIALVGLANLRGLLQGSMGAMQDLFYEA